MIKVEMWLHSARTGRKTQLAKVTIVNDGTGSLSKANYMYAIRGKTDRILREGEIKNWPRNSYEPHVLLMAVIADAYPVTSRRVKWK